MPDAKPDTPLGIAELTEDSLAETTMEKSPGIVCPQGEDGPKQTANYFYSRKKLPPTFPENKSGSELEIHIS